MRIIVLTQNENLYLPNSFAIVCKALVAEIVCIVSSPAMSTHGGLIKGFIKHFRLFGIKGTLIMGARVMLAKLKADFFKPKLKGPFYSIKQVADAFNIPFYHVSRVKDQELQDIIYKHHPDLLISISCPQIIGKNIRDRFHAGCINVHGAPLPRYRGLMPAFWALRNGEKTTAVTVHDIADKLDNGDILIQKAVEITSDDTWDSVVRKTKAAGAKALVEAVNKIRTGTIKRCPNLDLEATYFSFPTARDRRAFLRAGRRFF